MKKRISLLIMAVILTVNMCPATVYAEKASSDEESSKTNSARDIYDEAAGTVTTGTQNDAIEDETDPDADIAEAVDALVGIDWEYISISDSDDLVELAKNCRLDTWSRNKHVTLVNDISLLGRDFEGIPTFGGVFDGQGHTISELDIEGNVSYAGLFSYVQKDAVIRNLHVSGSVVPQGEQVIIGGIAGDNSGVIAECSFEGVVSGSDYVGGIAGINELTGIISGCETSGYIRGVHFTGGIAGENMGNITGCTNDAPVNTSNTDTTITDESLKNLQALLDVLNNARGTNDDEARTSSTVSDAGGIAGLSIGIISHSTNHGTVGYEHVGYNIGGIAGRQSGYIYSCINNGEILGRKDVGGITGQAEPYITIDFSSDIAYQLSESIAKLHDLVTVTLRDTRNQSDTITNRLSVIQQYTTGAISDAKYLAENTVDFANGVSGAATEAFSRVDYILAESSKQDGLLDQTAYAGTNIGKAMENTREAVEDLEIGQYMSDSDKQLYNDSKNTIEKSTVEYKGYYSEGLRGNYNLYIDTNQGTRWMTYYPDDGTAFDHTINTAIKPGKWKYPDGSVFPKEGDDTDAQLDAAAKAEAAAPADQYAQTQYSTNHPEHTYVQDVADASATVSGTILKYADVMADETRGDAIDAVNSLQGAAANLSTAGSQAKGIVSELASRGAITFPTLSADYKAHTTSLADNLQIMNDNFGLLNQELNNATYDLTDDLEAVSDQFNDILLLYTDALDGVLEKDYTQIITDDSLKEAETCTDATISGSINYGIVHGDINVGGIAGTMAIDYDYDKESDVTGIKDSKLNTSYITKCVLRDDRNYAEVKSVKNYAGGVCGLQEMGTVLRGENYSSVSSDSGDDVGGIAGSSLSYIVSSSSRGTMEGNNYIGGIVGDGTHIRDCVALVAMDAHGSRYGAIAGHIKEDGEVRNNYFVSDTLAGIDRVSYSLKAEPITYSELMNVQDRIIEIPAETDDTTEKPDTETDEEDDTEGDEPEISYGIPIIPTDFDHLTVTYMLDDGESDDPVQISKARVNYGDHIAADDYPSVPDKTGFYVEWDRPSIDNVSTDTTVTAVYTRYLTTLSDPTGAGDKDHQSEILVDGAFKEGDSLIVARSVNYDEDDISTLSSYETIHLVIPDDGADTHQIRFRPETFLDYDAYEKMPYKLLINENGEWRELEKTGSLGGYNTYEIPGNEVDLKLDLSKVETGGYKYAILFVVIGVIALGLIILIIWAVTRRKSRKQIRRVVRQVKTEVKTRIDSKETLFVPDDAVTETTGSEEADAAPDDADNETEDTEATADPDEDI